MTKPPRIVCAAMRMQDGTIVPGVRHYSPDMRSVLHKIYGMGYHLAVAEQGFINTLYQFVSREDAWIAAGANNQIIREVSSPGILYSENLY